MNKILITIILLFLSSSAFATDPPIQLYDEGVLQGVVFKFNCVGDGIVCTKSGITGIITVGTDYSLSFLGSGLTFLGSPLTFLSGVNTTPVVATGQLKFLTNNLTFAGSSLIFNP